MERNREKALFFLVSLLLHKLLCQTLMISFATVLLRALMGDSNPLWVSIVTVSLLHSFPSSIPSLSGRPP